MGLELFFGAVVLLACFAVFDLVVGVSNDAANFLNSSIGSRVAPRRVILMVASLGILAGVTFSGGMMEVARKGIFHPEFFTMPELLFIFLAVMITDVILLDLFNTFGFPTSTTVSIVFELLGAAVAISVLKIMHTEGQDLSHLADYINTSKAMVIIFGILFSVAVAFVSGTIAQFFSRLLFTFNYAKRFARYGALWGGVALASITYFILVKGAKGSTIMSPEATQWIVSNALLLFLIIVPAAAIVLQTLMWLKINIFRPIVLIGTFALAMAFAANDLVNFIGVPMAGWHAYQAASATADPLNSMMGALGQKVPTENYLLLLAGAVMVMTLWISRKARTVSDTEIGLSQQHEGEERFESSAVSRLVVRWMRNTHNVMVRLVPRPVYHWFEERMDPTQYVVETDVENRPRYDLLRASVNLMVASAVISYATSQKLPLSTTYVTFMVAMGTSFADRAWGSESAVYRIAGVFAVISGWFMTAFFAFSISAAFAFVIYFFETGGVIALLLLAGLVIWKNHHRHSRRIETKEMDRVFNLRKVTSLNDTVYTTFEQVGFLLKEIRQSLDRCLDGLFAQNRSILGTERDKSKRFQKWSNIICANIFKAMRLMQEEDRAISYKYGQTIRRLQKLVDGHRDIVMRAHAHVDNHHAGLLDVQVAELREVRDILMDVFQRSEAIIEHREEDADLSAVRAAVEKLRRRAQRLHEDQLSRIHDGESKTRLTILYYAIVGNAMMLAKQNLKLLEIFRESFGPVEEVGHFEME